MNAPGGAIVRAALEVLAGGTLLLVPALWNGYPFVFPDTGSYVRHALELQGITDRPPYYSILILPLHATVSLWPVAFAQCCLAAGTLRGVAALLLPGLSSARFLAGVVLLVAFTSLPYHAAQIVPDLLAGLIPLFVFALVWGWPRISRLGRALLFAITAGACATHQSHLPLAIATFGVAGLARAGQGGGLREVARVAGLGAGAAGIAAGAFAAYGLVMVGRPTLAPDASLFLLARSAADGPALDYLEETCPSSGNAFCPERERLGADLVQILWEPGGALARTIERVGPEGARRAAREVIAGVLATRPAEVARAAAANTLRQLARFGALDTLCPPDCEPGTSVDIAISRHFAGEYRAFRGSRQLRGELPIAALRALHLAAFSVSALAVAAAIALAWRRGDAAFLGLCAVIASALVTNALVTGALSAPFHRYQSRIVWLVPLAALVGLTRRGVLPFRRSGSIG
jgi:hypothetical protein